MKEKFLVQVYFPALHHPWRPKGRYWGKKKIGQRKAKNIAYLTSIKLLPFMVGISDQKPGPLYMYK